MTHESIIYFYPGDEQLLRVRRVEYSDWPVEIAMGCSGEKQLLNLTDLHAERLLEQLLAALPEESIAKVLARVEVSP